MVYRDNRMRFATLLATLLGLLAIAPVLAEQTSTLPAVRLAFSGVLIAGVYAVSGNRRVLRVGLGLALPALAVSWVTYAVGGLALHVATFAIEGAFLGYVAFVVLRSVLEQERVTADTIYGGICVYLLVGLVWQVAFSLLETAAPGSYAMGGRAISEASIGGGAGRFPELIYFSYVTMTTLGYGDIVPTTSLARALASSEAIAGQLFVAIFIARLVGLHLAHSSRHG